MADDTRQSPSSSTSSSSPITSVSSSSENPHATPSQSLEAPALPLPPPRRPLANTMPGGTAHTAGGKRPEDENLTYFEVVRNLPADYYLTFYKRPCVRDSQLTGIGAGFVAGNLAAILRNNVNTSTSYAVATWCIASCAHYQYCVYRRKKERDGMRQAQEIMAQKRAAAAAKQQSKKRERDRQQREEEERKREEARRKSWGYWAEKNLKFW